MAGQIEEVEVRHPALPHVSGHLPVDEDWIQGMVIRLQGRSAGRRGQDKIPLAEPGLYRTVVLGALVDRLRDFAGRCRRLPP